MDKHHTRVPPGGPPTAKQESELVKIKKQLNESA